MIVIAADHGGYKLKNYIISILHKKYEIIDVGTYDTDPVDYPDICKKMINILQNVGKNTIGIIICGTGIGVSICCNRFIDMNCALCHDNYTAKMARKHNNANILALGGNVVKPAQAIDIIEIFITTNFEGGRHQQRLNKI